MSDEITVKDRAPVDPVKDELVTQLDQRDDLMREERDAEIAKLRKEIDDMRAKIAADVMAHREEDKVKPCSPARIMSAIVMRANGMSDESSIKGANAEHEFDVIRQHEDERVTRVQEAGTDTIGGFWVPEQYLPQEFVDTLRATPIIYQLGARQLTSLVGSPVTIPRKTGNSTAYWVAEGASITGSTLTAGQINLEPHAAAALVRMSNRLRMLSNPAVEAMVNEDIATTLGLFIEVAALRGTGAAGSPMGLKATPNINTVTTASLNVTNGAAYISAVDQADALNGSPGWLMHPRPWYTYIAKYRTKHTEGQGVAQAGVGAAFPETWMGYPVARSTNVKATTSGTTDVVFGDWRQLIVGQWAGVSFAASTEAGDAFVKNETWVRAIAEVDVGVRQETAFTYNSSVTD